MISKRKDGMLYNENMSNLDEEYQYYIDNQDELANQYSGKYLIVKDKSVKGVYDSEIEAYQEAKKQFEPGTFLIKPCLPKGADKPQVFHTRAFFRR